MSDTQRDPVQPVDLLNGRLLAKNSLWNLVGGAIPLLVAVVAIPLLIKGLGTERFGALTLVWMGIGYFSLFDIGLGQALTKLVAEKLGVERPEAIARLIWTTLALMGILGVAGTAVVTLISPWLVHNALKIPPSLQHEVLLSFYLLGASIPVVIATAGLCGVLEASQRFDLINTVRIPMGLFNFLSPLLMLLVSHTLVAIVGVLLIGRMVGCLAFFWLCLRIIPSLRKLSLDRSVLRPLIFFGGWTTITNIIGPLMVYMDRFLIGVLVSMMAVAYYTTPYEVVSRLMIIPFALMAVLFPAFSACLVQDRNRAVMLFDRGVNYIFLTLFPITLVIVTLAEDILQIWLGQEFSQNSTAVLQWLAVGVFISSLAKVPFAIVQAVGRPDMIAKLHVVELPFYLGGLCWLLSAYGIKGAAIAWTFRVFLDTLILFSMAYRLVPEIVASINSLARMLSIALLILASCSLAPTLALRAMLLCVTLTIFTIVAWFFILEPQERHLFKGKLRLFSLLGG